MKLSNKEWLAHCSDYQVHTNGDAETVREALALCGIDDDQIDLAFETLADLDHNVAEFGVYKTFMGSFWSVALTRMYMKQAA